MGGCRRGDFEMLLASPEGTPGISVFSAWGVSKGAGALQHVSVQRWALLQTREGAEDSHGVVTCWV